LVIALKVVAFEKLTTGIQLVITKFNELSWGWVSDSGGIRTSGLPFQSDRSKQANDTTHPPTAASYADILHQCQKPGLLPIVQAVTLDFSLITPETQVLLRMVQDMSMYKFSFIIMW
jgi:hypothetical protein